MIDDTAEKEYVKRVLFAFIPFAGLLTCKPSPTVWMLMIGLGISLLLIHYFLFSPEHVVLTLYKDFLFSIVLADIVIFLLMFYEPLANRTNVFLCVFLLIGLGADIKLFFFPGKADEKILTFFWRLAIVSTAIYVLYAVIRSVFVATVFPVLFVFLARQLARKAKGKLSCRQAFALCLSAVLFGEYLTAETSPYIFCRSEKDDAYKTAATFAEKRKAEKNEDIPPVFKAIVDGDKTALKKLVKTEKLDIVDSGMSPLMIATMTAAFGKSDAEIVDILIKAGADVNFRAGAGKHTAMDMAVLFNHVEIARMLAEAGADITAPRPYESLWILAWNGGWLYRFDPRIFAFLWKKKAPLFTERASFPESLFLPFGLFGKD